MDEYDVVEAGTDLLLGDCKSVLKKIGLSIFEKKQFEDIFVSAGKTVAEYEKDNTEQNELSILGFLAILLPMDIYQVWVSYNPAWTWRKIIFFIIVFMTVAIIQVIEYYLSGMIFFITVLGVWLQQLRAAEFMEC